MILIFHLSAGNRLTKNRYASEYHLLSITERVPVTCFADFCVLILISTAMPNTSHSPVHLMQGMYCGVRLHEL